MSKEKLSLSQDGQVGLASVQQSDHDSSGVSVCLSVCLSVRFILTYSCGVSVYLSVTFYLVECLCVCQNLELTKNVFEQQYTI